MKDGAKYCRLQYVVARRYLVLLLVLGMWGYSATAAVAGEALLADAAEKRDHQTLRALLLKGSDVKAAQPDGMTALHWAAHLDDLESAKLLKSANPNVANRYGVTPLVSACQNGSSEMVELLLAQGADPNTSVRGGRLL